jgi:hypothetical protein
MVLHRRRYTLIVCFLVACGLVGLLVSYWSTNSEAGKLIAVDKEDTSHTSNSPKSIRGMVVKDTTNSRDIPSFTADRLESFREAFTGDVDTLLNYYLAGGKIDSSLKDKFLAQQIGSACETAVTRKIHAEIPNVSGALERDIAAARTSLDRVCAGFYSIRIEELQQSISRLLAEVEAEGSNLSREYGALRKSNGTDAEVIARQQLNQALDEFGAASLLWNSGNLAEVLILAGRDQALGPEMTLDESLANSILIVAMCIGGIPCGENSILYMNLCANSGRCGGSITEGILGDLDHQTRQYVLDKATLVANAIAAKKFKSLGL